MSAFPQHELRVPEIARDRGALGFLFLKYGTDKNMNGYTQYYERIFAARQHEPTRLLEIGIGTVIPGAHSSMVGYGETHYLPGASLRAWRDYFDHPESDIHGLDVQADTQFTGEPRITTHLVNSMDQAQVEGPEMPQGTWDIIIDDGNHWLESQLVTLSYLWPRVNSGGFYVIEDIINPQEFREHMPRLTALTGDAPCMVSSRGNWAVIYKM